MMKCFVALFALLAVALAVTKEEFVEEFKAMVKEVGTNCISQVGATSDDLDALMKHEEPSKHESMCLITCMHKHWGIQNAEGNVDLESAVKTLVPLKEFDADMYIKLKQMFETCAGKVANDADPCITGLNLMKCGKEEGHKVGLNEAFEF